MSDELESVGSPQPTTRSKTAYTPINTPQKVAKQLFSPSSTKKEQKEEETNEEEEGNIVPEGVRRSSRKSIERVT
jgi:hypothetical protein